MAIPLLDVRNLSVRYQGRHGEAIAVDRLSFDIAAGEAVALVGESGCGKSTTALALSNLLPDEATSSGEVTFDGLDLFRLPPKAWRSILGRRIGMIFQEPMSALNPVYTIGDQIAEVLHAHERLSRKAARSRVLDLLDLVSMPEPHRRIASYPHELSGGQRQRAMIALAIALTPRLLIADEPTTALDSTIQGQILELIDRLRRDLSMSLLLISHDLTLVSRWTDRVVVMHSGKKMEELKAAHLFQESQHPYTKGLIGASIRLSDGRHASSERLNEIRSHRKSNGTISFEIYSPPAAAKTNVNQTSDTLLEVEKLTVRYGLKGKIRPAVDGVTFDLTRGETLGLVGESGSGKSSLAKALTRLIPVVGGQMLFEGRDIAHATGADLHAFRRQVQIIFQDPYASLNPRRTVGDILNSVLHAHQYRSSADRTSRIGESLDQVGLPRSAVERFPHEFSGGQRQRIAIARALILRPSLVICDEPVSALDVSVQAQILNLLADLKVEAGLSYLFISHDLAVVKYISDRIMVMKDGHIVESGNYQNIWSNPSHEYTRKLMSAAS
ncbi:ABC transporter ATP-binding protein [Agrobacterium tumefaciens]|uniref:ABC transporter ATP-binding protein n=1 Tax=Agrobacterium tumefaciens TaxID=358 RepID=UPI0021CFA7BF|nr:ABC transporter ATP-binding protein [Agrobacterium tumefaciens]NTZ64067.1 ABC transporter ATP-binding protein [Agrobacterium tumefaciens]UXT00216.1 ABC transporter ATP-binding protein [Agrobacterium tumefaciens]UXT52916.1 ABC transporter ATP-binding protein [Agrobacterium tumefaciens]